jgi:hypothetical protein
LRIFTIVTSFNPLRCKVVREGVARLAAKVRDPRSPTDPDTVLTGSNYRRQRRLPIGDISISVLLEKLDFDPSMFWGKVDQLVEQALHALFPVALTRSTDFSGVFYFAGMDLMMRGGPDDYSLLFIETNYRPTMKSPNETVDRQLRPAHREWLREIDLQVWLRQVGRATSSPFA